MAGKEMGDLGLAAQGGLGDLVPALCAFCCFTHGKSIDAKETAHRPLCKVGELEQFRGGPKHFGWDGAVSCCDALHSPPPVIPQSRHSLKRPFSEWEQIGQIFLHCGPWHFELGVAWGARGWE